jgi:hypothetical protein
MWHVWVRKNVDRVLLEKFNESEYIEDLGMVGEIILKLILIKDKEYIVFMYLRLETSGMLLCML